MLDKHFTDSMDFRRSGNDDHLSKAELHLRRAVKQMMLAGRVQEAKALDGFINRLERADYP